MPKNKRLQLLLDRGFWGNKYCGVNENWDKEINVANFNIDIVMYGTEGLIAVSTFVRKLLMLVKWN